MVKGHLSDHCWIPNTISICMAIRRKAHHVHIHGVLHWWCVCNIVRICTSRCALSAYADKGNTARRMNGVLQIAPPPPTQSLKHALTTVYILARKRPAVYECQCGLRIRKQLASGPKLNIGICVSTASASQVTDTIISILHNKACGRRKLIACYTIGRRHLSWGIPNSH